MFQIQVQAESGEWFPVGEPYSRAAVAVEDAIALGTKYDAQDYLQVAVV